MNFHSQHFYVFVYLYMEEILIRNKNDRFY